MIERSASLSSPYTVSVTASDGLNPVVTVEFTASSDTVVWDLNGADGTFPDGNPILNGITLEVLGAAIPFQITDIAASETEVTLTWNSRSGTEYAVEYKGNLADPVWIEIDDGVGSGGDETTFTFSNPSPGAERIFFRVQEN